MRITKVLKDEDRLCEWDKEHNPCNISPAPYKWNSHLDGSGTTSYYCDRHNLVMESVRAASTRRRKEREELKREQALLVQQQEATAEARVKLMEVRNALRHAEREVHDSG